MDVEKLRKTAKLGIYTTQEENMFENIEIAPEPFEVKEQVHFGLDLVPVTEDLRSIIVKKKSARILGFKDGKEEKRAELLKKLDAGTISPEDLVNDGWLAMWMKYYRFEYIKDKGIINEQYTGPKGIR